MSFSSFTAPWFSFSLLFTVAAVGLRAPAVAAAAAYPLPSGHTGTSQTLLTRRANQVDSNLPAQVGGIVGSYVLLDAFILVLLLTVGRRLRRAAQTSNHTLEMVILNPVKKPSIPTNSQPVSPEGAASPDKPRSFTMPWSLRSHRSHASPTSSVATIDESIVLSDRRKAQGEMEKLYAAVMEHDAKTAPGVHGTIEEYPAESQIESPLSSVSSPKSQMPPTPRETTLPLQRESSSKKALGPRTSSRLSKISNLSIFSHASRSSSGSTSKLHSPSVSIRNLAISPPMGSPDMATAASYSDNQPLSPRLYNPGPPPSAPLPSMSPRTVHMSPSYRQGDPTGQARAGAPPVLKLSSATNSSSSLPFRQAFNPPQSAPATKTTILERPSNLSRGPRTGLPATPYSPYMPFTPVTPITPSRMITKREKRRLDREPGMRVLMEDDMVRNDEELWGY